jgi:hypothetical protein
MALTVDHELRIDAKIDGQVRTLLTIATVHARITEADVFRALTKSKLPGKDLGIEAGSGRLLDIAKLLFEALKEFGADPKGISVRLISPPSVYTPGAQHDGEVPGKPA